MPEAPKTTGDAQQAEMELEKDNTVTPLLSEENRGVGEGEGNTADDRALWRRLWYARL